MPNMDDTVERLNTHDWRPDASRTAVLMIDLEELHPMLMLTALLSVGCWWGFAGYIYFRRDYFQ